MSRSSLSVFPTGADHRRAMIGGVEGPAVATSTADRVGMNSAQTHTSGGTACPCRRTIHASQQQAYAGPCLAPNFPSIISGAVTSPVLEFSRLPQKKRPNNGRNRSNPPGFVFVFPADRCSFGQEKRRSNLYSESATWVDSYWLGGGVSLGFHKRCPSANYRSSAAPATATTASALF